MNQAEEHPVRLPPSMRAALEQYRKRVRVIKLAEGALAAVFGLAVSYLTVFGLDRWFDTPAVLRGILLAVGSVGAVVVFPLKYRNWVWRQRRLEQVARLLRHKYPRFGDHLLGIIELAHSGSQLGASRALVEAAMRQVDAELRERDLRDAVPHPRHRRWVWAAGVPVALLVAVLGIVPAAGVNALVRWAAPWRDVERYTFAQLQGGTGMRVVPYAEPFLVQASLKEDSVWKPETGTARYEDQSLIVSERRGTTYSFEIPPQTRDGRLLLAVGDVRLVVGVEPKTRPALTELVADVQLPPYLQRSEPQIEDVRSGKVSAVKGSTAIFRASATRELATATLNDRPQPVDGIRLTTESVRVEASTEYRLAWQDRYGLAAREPQVLRVEALEDGAPTVAFQGLRNNQVLLPSEVLAFEIQAADDFGVRQVGLEWEGVPDPLYNPKPSGGEKLVAAGAPASDTLTVPATFSAEREQVRPQSLRLRAFAEDYRPDRERAYSSYVVIHVLSPAEHYRWLTEQMSQWAGAAQEVYEKELQLHQINRELTELPPEALDDPAQRKRILAQAAAERTNAAQLDALIDSGREWVREATKNEEFAAGSLEGWAETLLQLEEIAGEQMPSVAELLGRASAAAGQPAAPGSESMRSGDPREAKTPDPAAYAPSEEPTGAAAGDADSGRERGDPYGPGGRPAEGVSEANEDLGTEADDALRDESGRLGGEPVYAPVDPTPRVGDTESGFNRGEKAEGGPPSPGGLSLPATTLEGRGRESKEEPKPPPTAAELVHEAVSEQQNLLEAFGKLAADMNDLLAGFENSTFVKRLKAASRRQIDLAAELNDLDGFGLQSDESTDLPRRANLGQLEVAASETVFTLQEDLVAYAERRPSENYSRVLDEMQRASVVQQIHDISLAIGLNEVGQSTIEAEYWADTLDRWAEQLVDPMGEQGPPSEGSAELPNLTPGMVLEVLRLIGREIQLREETRELDRARPAMDEEGYEKRGGELSRTQGELAGKARALAGEVEQLPYKDELGKEWVAENSKKLSDAAAVMDEVEGLLGVPETGSPTMAAIAEVLEILLEAHRVANAPRIMKSPSATAPALLLLGLGDDGSQAFIEERAPDQATGQAGRKLPEEFRQGLDIYLNALEGKTVE